MAETRKGQVQPNNQPKPGPMANTQGLIVPETSPNFSGRNNSAPTPVPETPKEEGWWKRWGSDVTHGVLDVVGLVPVLGEVANGAGALIYLAEGDPVSAAFDAAAMWPAGGQAATMGKYGTKAATKLAKEAAEAAEKKLAKEAAEAAEKKAAKEAEEKAAKKGADGNGDGGRVDGPKKRGRGPCDHLKKGDAGGKGDYRGGSYGGTTKPGVESHHAPANSTSPLPKSQGPAVQMDPTDHKGTSSHGHQGADGALYRSEIESLLKDGRWRDAMAQEIKDIRRVARETGDPKKYNEAIKEMLEYFNCLKTHGLLG